MKSKHVISLIIFILLTLIITFPLILNLTVLTSVGKEEYLLSYILNWNIHALTHFPSRIFQMPIFYPYQNALAFSDPLFTSSILALPFVKIFNQPFLAYNFNLILSFILNGFFTYLIIYQLTKNWWAGLVSGVLFSFSIGKIDSLAHLQILTTYWIPLGIYFFLQFVNKKLNKYALLTALCFILQILNTIFLGYVYIFTLAIFALTYFFKKKITRKQLLKLFQYIFSALVLIAIIFIPYLKVSSRWRYTRSLEDIWAGSSYFLEYLYPTSHSRLETLAHKIIIKQPWPSYLGAAVSILGFISLIYLIKNSKKLFKKSFILASLITVVSGLLMSFGPYFQIIKQKPLFSIPLPYLIAFYLIPGFKSMRVPQRWSHLVLLGLALLSGIVLSKLARKIKPGYFKILTVFIIFTVIVEIRLPLFKTNVLAKSAIPQVYQWLKDQPSSVVLELPVQTWIMPLADLEIQRLHYHSFLFQSNHQFINGSSGFEPPDWTKDMSILRTLPSDSAIEKLKQLKVELLIVHYQEMEQIYQKDKESLPLKNTLVKIKANQKFQKIYQDDQTTVYKL